MTHVAPRPPFRDPAKLDAGAPEGVGREPIQFLLEAVAQALCRYAYFLEQRTRHAFSLVEQCREEMLVADLGVVVLRSEILRRLQRFLPFLGEFVRSQIRYPCRQFARARRSSRPQARITRYRPCRLFQSARGVSPE